jgi:hypothetical protein
MWYALWRELTAVSAGIGDESGSPPDPDPPTPPGHVHDHRNLINVTPDQHHKALFHMTPYEYGSTYDPGSMVLDDGWTMVANKQTSERASPQPTGAEFYLYQGTSPAAAVTAKQIIFGNKYTFGKSGYLNGYRIYAVSGNVYAVSSVQYPSEGPAIFTPILTFTATTTGWTEITTVPVIIFEGTVFDLFAVVQEPDPTPTVFTGNWSYFTPNNAGVPVSGQISHANQQLDQFRIHYIDDDAGDRTLEIQALGNGDVVVDDTGFRWSIQNNADAGTYAVLTVAPATQSGPDGARSFDFETTVATPITRMVDVNWWGLNPPVTGSIQGLYIEDGVYDDIVPDTSAYGTDLLMQEGEVSEDWDVAAPASTGVTGGGGGLSDHDLDYHSDVVIGGGFAHAVWDANTAVQVNLGDADHQAASTGSENARVEGTVSKSDTDTFSMEITIDEVGDGGGIRCYVGFRSGSSPAPTNLDRIWWRGNGAYQMQGDNSAAGAWPTYVNGDILTFVFKAGNLWVRVNGGAWVGGGDPELDTSPSYSGLTGADIRASMNSDNAGVYPTVTINAGDRVFSHMPAAYDAGMASGSDGAVLDDILVFDGTNWINIPQSAVFGGASIEGLGRFDVALASTTDNMWTTAYVSPQGLNEWAKTLVVVEARRTDASGFYGSNWTVMSWSDGGAQCDEDSIYEVGAPQPTFRCVGVGDTVEYQVRGVINQDWEWALKLYKIELN